MPRNLKEIVYIHEFGFLSQNRRVQFVDKSCLDCKENMTLSAHNLKLNYLVSGTEGMGQTSLLLAVGK
jgi:hypothetical protein